MRWRALIAVAVMSLAAVIPLNARRPAMAAVPARSPTALDSSFAGGLVTDDRTALGDEAFAVVVQADGAVVVAGRTNHDWHNPSSTGDLLVSRLTPSGSFDTAFGSGGSVVFDAPGHPDQAYAVALQEDGKIVVAGVYADKPAVVRLTPSGTLDADFAGGIVTIPDATYGVAQAVAIQRDGKVVFGGSGVAVGRLLPNGTRDASFGSNGVVLETSGLGFRPSALVLQPDGAIVVGGTVEQSSFVGTPVQTPTLARYSAIGALDPSFGTGGVVHANLDTDYVDRNGVVSGVALQPDGKIVVAATASLAASSAPPVAGGEPPPPATRRVSTSDVALLRFLPDGSPDTAFAASGRVITRVAGQPNPAYANPAAIITPEASSWAMAVTVDTAGRILLAGRSSQPFFNLLVLRYTPWGLLDTTFGQGGAFVPRLGAPESWGNALSLQPDGNVVVAGAASAGFGSADYRVLVARLVPGSSEGTVWAWGWNAVGQLGDGTRIDRSSPVQVGGLRGMVAVSAGAYHTLALGGDGTVWAWGWNGVGQLGDGTTTDRSRPVRVPGLSGVVAVAAGVAHSLALRGDGSVWAWGWNGVGQLGDGTTATRLTPTRVSGVDGVAAISAGAYHNLVRRDDGRVLAWGWNVAGQLGDGTTVDRQAPVVLPLLYANYAYDHVSAGGLHSLGVSVLGDGLAWGWNGVGQIATPEGGVRLSPAVSLLPRLAMSAGAYHSLSLGSDGAVLSAGWNAVGQLGDGTTTTHSWGPVKGLSDVAAVSAGGYHSLALTRDHRLWAWGWNGVGQLGLGGPGDRSVPATVSCLPNVAVMSAGAAHSAAIQG